jgi:tryptophan synthase alpha chain
VSAIAEAFARAKAEQRAALVCYAMGGDPDLEATEALLLALDAAGADLIELGVPFSDPIADGPVLQAAAVRALNAGTTLRSLLGMAARLKGKLRAPVVLMGYANPFLRFGLQQFAAAAEAAGISGTIIPDLPLEETPHFRDALTPHGIEMVLLCAPTTGRERMAKIAQASRGFLYAVSVTGVTGARADLPPEVAAYLQTLRELSPVPVAVGFGIARPEQAAAMGKLADGVVVGSALVAAHHEHGVAAAAALIRSLRAAL